MNDYNNDACTTNKKICFLDNNEQAPLLIAESHSRHAHLSRLCPQQKLQIGNEIIDSLLYTGVCDTFYYFVCID